MALRFGLFFPPFAGLAEPGRVVELARAAERSGWDGFFLWDHILALPGMAVADPWVTMAAVAQSTARMRLGMLVTPLARRRPWVLARQTATLDRLSGGRLVVGVGLGDDSIGEFSSFRGEVSEPVQRGPWWTSRSTCCAAFGRGTMSHGRANTSQWPAGPFCLGPSRTPYPFGSLVGGHTAVRWPERPGTRVASRCSTEADGTSRPSPTRAQS
jgi:hypothetical protein